MAMFVLGVLLVIGKRANQRDTDNAYGVSDRRMFGLHSLDSWVRF